MRVRICNLRIYWIGAKFPNGKMLLNTHTHTHTHIYIYISWPTIIEGHPKSSFSISSTPMCWGGRYSSPWISSVTLDLYLIILNVKHGVTEYHFYAFRMSRPGIEPRFPGPLVNTAPTIYKFTHTHTHTE